MIVRKAFVLIEVIGSALYLNWRSSPAARYQEGHTLLAEPFVVVNMSCAHDDSGLDLRGNRLEIITQSYLVRPRVMAYIDSCLKVRHRWVVQAEKHEARRAGKVQKLCVQPVPLIAAPQQRGIAVQGNRVNGIAQFHG